MMSTQILVVDDDPQLQKLMRVGLGSYGYEIILANNGESAITLAARKQPNLFILDINLGHRPDGVDVCKTIREWTTAPVIMLSANGDKQSVLSALAVGADDYVTKPFDMEILVARIKAVMRRSSLEASSISSGEIRVHDLVIDLVNRRVTLKGEIIHFTPIEYKVLTLLATNPGKVLTFNKLLMEIKGASSERPKQQHFVRVYINTIRKKLKDDSANRISPLYIFNEPGIGYRFTDIEASE
ncbi:MAG: response regulator transcription factor [Anaerolineae bacterium]|nr:response regulator transcription factor [Anaerolineae bacterium]